MPQIRLLELYDTVDLFVVYETPYTHLGTPKPCYFNESLAGRRLRGWDAVAAWLRCGAVLPELSEA
jgi:hypothetical protein